MNMKMLPPFNCSINNIPKCTFIFAILNLVLLLQIGVNCHRLFPKDDQDSVGSSRTKRSSDTAQRDLVCIRGLNLNKGATFPKGDIQLQVGGTLEVNCTIDLDNPAIAGLTSKNIEFSFAKHAIPDEAMEVTVVDNSTAMLRVQNMNESTPYLSCSLRRPSDNTSIHICQNEVDVGHKPLEVLNFKCLARNWASLNCTWNKPYNPVRTTYKLSYRLHRFYMPCPPGSQLSYNNTDSCEWNGQTEPHYQPNSENIVLVVNGSNPLKPDGVLWEYTIRHWSIIIPAKPERLTLRAISPHEIEVTWGFSNFDLFKPGLLHRITACTIEHVEICVTSNYSSNFTQKALTQRIFLPFAYMPYRVQVQMKSPMSENTEEFWSKPAIAEIRTPGKAPEFPPQTTTGSFEVSNKYQIRDIFVYWQTILPHHHNGSDFHMEFKVYEDGQLRSDVRPHEIRDSFAVFSNLSMQAYKFEITSVNSNGKSPSSSYVYVPSTHEAPPTPTSVTKLYYNNNGTYEISWRQPTSTTHDEIISYNIFRCNGSRELPGQCNILLDWQEIEASQNLLVYDNLPMHTVFKFGVAANTKNMSSGMILASCELVHNKVPGKITDVRIGATSSYTMLVKWDLDCTYKPGQIEGFRITYCLIKPASNTCTDLDNNKKEIRAGANDFQYEMKSLQPFSKYMIAISIITHAGESQTSDPIFAFTTQAAPSDPPQVKVIDSTNITGVIAIEAPANPNGIVKKYKVIYNPIDFRTDTSNQIEISTSDLIVSSNQQHFFNLTNLENNSNYSISVMACTVSCSNLSEPAFLMTKVGTTKLTVAPSVNYEHETFIISWKTPRHLGGPIDYFEVAVKRNGKDVFPDDLPTVNYKSGGQSLFEHEVHLQCESNTNVSAQVRAVSLVDGEYLYGNWSPEGSLSCSGIATWALWLIGIGVMITLILIVAFASKILWKKVKDMKGVQVVFPPGMELNGVPHQVKRRQHSGGDTHSFGKENLTYQLHLANQQTEESKDFLPDSNKETQSQNGDSVYVGTSQDADAEFGERHLPLQESINEALAMSVGKIADWSWQPNITSIMRDERDRDASSDFTRTNSFTIGILSASPPNLSDHSTTIDDDYLERRVSPSPSNPLLHEVNAENSGDGGGGDELSGIEDDDLEHYKKVGLRQGSPHNYQNTGSRPYSGGGGGGGCTGNSSGGNNSPVEPRSVNVSVQQQSSHDESQSSQSPNTSQCSNVSVASSSSTPTFPTSVTAPAESRPIVVTDVPMTNNSSYIKWAYMKNDPVNEEKSLNAPYYQVGILLDSSSS